jgi:protein SCO1/2
MKTRRRLILFASSASLVLAACGKLGSQTSDEASFKGVDITGADYTYALPDQNGQIRRPEDFKGKVTAVFFGYTQCPDVCPTTLAELAQLKKSLGKEGDRLQVVFVTVDPERDSVQALKPYVGSFDPSFVALRGTPEQTATVAKSFKVFFAKSPGKTPDTYTIDHTAGTYLFDGSGRVRLFERYGGAPDALDSDVKTLLAVG